MKRAEKNSAELQGFGGSGRVAILRKFPDAEIFRIADQLSENDGLVWRAVELEADGIRTRDEQRDEDEEGHEDECQAAERCSIEHRIFLHQHVLLDFTRDEFFVRRWWDLNSNEFADGLIRVESYEQNC